MADDFQIMLVISPQGASPMPWWPKVVTACIDHDAGEPDLVGWSTGFNKKDKSNLFATSQLESVLHMWIAEFGPVWVFKTYCPATRETFDNVQLPAKKKRRKR